MQKNKWMMLQLFAEGGEGATGDSGASAVENNGADDGHQRLMELGVPEEKLRKMAYKLPKTPVSEPVNKQEEQVASAETKPTEGQTPKRMTWDEIKNDPEYNAEIQKIVKSRLKDDGIAKQKLDAMSEVLEIISGKYGVDATDAAALKKAVEEDDSFYEEAALEAGMSVSQYKQVQKVTRENARMKQQQEQYLRNQFEQHHEQRLIEQSEELKKLFPNFDLAKERENKVFASLIAPGGVDVKSAYYAIHHNELQAAAMQITAQKTAEQISSSIQSGARRPLENGSSSKAPSVTTFDYRKASPEQRAALRKRIMEAAANGEKLYPGQ
jgi:hypothetical protein